MVDRHGNEEQKRGGEKLQQVRGVEAAAYSSATKFGVAVSAVHELPAQQFHQCVSGSSRIRLLSGLCVAQ
jgi:hypothetical protein